MGEPVGSRAVLSSRTFCDDRSGLSVLSEMAVTGQIQILNTWNYIFNFVSVTFNAKSHMWLVATILDSTGVENEEQQVKFIMLFCGVIIPNQTFFFFFFSTWITCLSFMVPIGNRWPKQKRFFKKFIGIVSITVNEKTLYQGWAG